MPVESIFAFAFALLGLVPGSDNIFVLAQFALYGKKAGVLVTLWLCTDLIVHTTAVALGVAVIFQTSIVTFIILKLVGAIYLLYFWFSKLLWLRQVVLIGLSQIYVRALLYIGAGLL